MNQFLLIAADLVAVVILVAMYFLRHRRRDLVVAFLTVNIGVLAVAAILGSSTVGVGLGLGLFGVLSIIRLRSSEIAQHEVAYYFAALAMGLIAGLGGTATEIWMHLGLIGLVLVTMAVGDFPGLLRRYRQQVVNLDQAYPDEVALEAALEGMLGATVHRVTVLELDLVNDTTRVDVKFEVAREGFRDAAGVAGRSSTRDGVEVTR